MRKLILISIILFIQVCSAQIVRVEMSPSILLPDDIANCKLVIEVTKETYIEGITFYPPHGLEVKPSSVSGIGLLSPSTSYELHFTIKARESGIHILPIYIRTSNGTVKYYTVVRVEDEMPKVVLDKTTLILNEVNEVGFTISSPIKINNVIVKPLFNANPRIVFIENNRGSLKFEPTKPMKLRFELEFYNGQNHHRVLQEVEVNYIESKGVAINVSPSYSSALIGDVIPVDLEVVNLRGDDIYSVEIGIRVNVSDLISKEKISIPTLKSGGSKLVRFGFCSRDAGYKEIKIDVKYVDELNVEHTEQAVLKLRILNQTALQFSGIEVERRINGLTVVGDICNLGRTKAYNVMIAAIGDGVEKTYYIEYLDPSDFDSFEINLPSVEHLKLIAKWNNELGEEFEIHKDVEIPKVKFEKSQSSSLPLLVSILALVSVLILIVFILRRR